MIILIGNQKGGAGKSTVTLLLGNYLVLVKNREVTVLDMDYQQSLYAKAEKAKIADNKPLYEVVPANLKDFPSLKELLVKSPKNIALIDLPGKMDDDDLLPVFQSADLILCPFSYDEFSVDSTLLFAMVLKRINVSAPLAFIPNRVKGQVRYETKESVDKALGKFGTVTPPVTERINFQRINILSGIPLDLAGVIIPVFDTIYNNFIREEVP
ncbi:MAG: ParA family protein [Pseudosphingobacterium sp.]|nr:ParA family protein [Pseudosphingobacterium sp.]